MQPLTLHSRGKQIQLGLINTVNWNPSIIVGVIALIIIATSPRAASSQVTLTPASVAFGSVLVGDNTAIATATLTNSTAGAVTGIATSLSGSGAGSFAILLSGTNICGASLAANSSCNIYVGFTPGSAANFSGTLSVSDSATSSPQTATLSGAGVIFDSKVGTAQEAQLVTVNVTMAGSLNSIQTLTKGATNLDYKTATGGTCTVSNGYSAGQACTVNIVFTPQYSGQRDGAILLLDAGGNVLGTTYLWGAGHGPEIVFEPAPPSQAPTYYKNPSSALVLDGAEDTFVLNNTTGNIYEFVWNGSGYNNATVALNIGPYETAGVMPSVVTSMAIDGAGNLLVGGDAFHPYNVISEIPLTGMGYGTPASLNNAVSSGVADQITVDKMGNVFYTDDTIARIVEVPKTNSGYGTATAIPFPGNAGPEGVAVDANENLYILAGSTIYILPWTGSAYGTPTGIPITGSPIDSSSLAIDGSGDLYFAACFTSAECSGNEYQIFEIPFNGSEYGKQIPVYQLYNGSVFNAAVPTSLQIDGAGNVYTTSEGISRNTGPTLFFASTAVGSTSTDSPQTVTATNIGDLAISFSGSTPDPSYPVNFPENSGDANLCAASTDLAQGESCDISVNFTPTASGGLSGDVVLTDNSLDVTGASQQIPLNGQATGSAPVASLSPTIAFGNQTEGVTSADMSATLSNSGNATLNITGITLGGTNSSDFAIATGANACATTLAQSATCLIYVTFRPSTTAAESATLSVADNAAGSPQISSLTGTGTPAPMPIASLSPSIAFGSQTEGVTSAPMSATLSNTGNATLNISGFTLSGTNAADFAIATATNACGTTLAQSSTCSIYVTFTPSTASPESATLSVADNASGSPQSASLSGTGTSAPVPIASLSPGIAFGNQTEGVTSAAMSATLSNTGNAALNISSITISGTNAVDFAIATGTNACATTVAPGSRCSIYVTFKPSTAGAESATLSVADNAAGSPQTSSLTGTGTAPSGSFLVSSPTAPQTAQPGGSAQYTINVAVNPSGDVFNSAVALAASGLPTGATASFSPSSVIPGTGIASSMMTVQLSASSARLSTPSSGTQSPLMPITFAFTLLGGCSIFRRRRRSRLGRLPSWLLFALLGIACTLGISACTNGGFALSTPASYTITVAGSSGSTQESTTVQLTVE